MDAIIYTSNTGYTEAYAKLLSEATGLPSYALKNSAAVKDGSKVIYLGWLMAGQVKGYKKAADRFSVQAVCAVGMAACGTQLDETRKVNKISCQLFVLQGGFDINKLHGIYKLMMTVMKKTAGKALSKKEDKTPEESDMLDLMLNGGSRVCLENLEPVLKWYTTCE